MRLVFDQTKIDFIGFQISAHDLDPHPVGQTEAAAGALPQRPLWASTGVKDPAFPDDMYVVELAGPGCVNTMPEPTLRAVADHGNLHGDTLDGTGGASQQVFDQLTGLGVDLDEVFDTLENEGVEKFKDAWEELLTTVSDALAVDRGAQ